MSRKEAKFKLPTIRPEKNCFSINNSETLISIQKDNVRLSPYLDLIVQRKRKGELSHLLHKKNYHADVCREKIQMQWKVQEENELEFQRTIVTHNKFLRRNLEKRERALAKIQTDQQVIKKREREIMILDQKLKFSNAIMEKMRNEIKKHSIYEDYLNSVIELDKSPYKSYVDFLAKYESLQLTKERCIVRQNEEMVKTVLWHTTNVDYFQSQDIILIGLRNELNNLRCKFDDVCRRNLNTESIITSIVDRTNELNSEVSTCQYMIDAIYRYMCHRRKIPHIDYSLREVKPKIEILKKTLGGWQKIMHSADITKNKKRSKDSRKSYMRKSSTSQGAFQWTEREPSEITDMKKI